MGTSSREISTDDYLPLTAKENSDKDKTGNLCRPNIRYRFSCGKEPRYKIYKVFNIGLCFWANVVMNSKEWDECHNIVKTPTTTSIQLNTTTIDVGFDMIMTVHTTHPTTHQELYLSNLQQTEQCKLTQSLTIS